MRLSVFVVVSNLESLLTLLVAPRPNRPL